MAGRVRRELNIEALKRWLRPFKYALWRFAALYWLRVRRLVRDHNAPDVRRLATFAPIVHLTAFRPPPARTLGASRLTANPHGMVREAFVADLENVRVLGDVGHVLKPDGTLYRDISFSDPATCYADSSWEDLSRSYGHAQPLDGTTFLLTSKWSRANYFHFLFELLPRLEMLPQNGIDLAAIDHWLVSPLDADVYWQALEECGVPRKRAIECDAGAAFDVRRVLAPSTLHGTGHMRPRVCEWLNRTFAAGTYRRRSGMRLYVGRDDASNRHLLNQQEILERVLMPLGFEPVRWDGQSVREQAALFAQADVVVGVNGAALSNLVFCAPGTRVIVVHYPIYLSRYFYELSHTVGLEYYYLVGETNPPLKSGEYNRDYFVDPASLAALLKLAGVC